MYVRCPACGRGPYVTCFNLGTGREYSILHKERHEAGLEYIAQFYGRFWVEERIVGTNWVIERGDVYLGVMSKGPVTGEPIVTLLHREYDGFLPESKPDHITVTASLVRFIGAFAKI